MDALATVLLRRAGAVCPPAPAEPAPADGAAWVRAFEADLAGRGWLLDAPLRLRFTQLDSATRSRWADWVLAVADEMLGADREHVPLYRAFPDTPANPEALYVERLLVHLFQADAAPCVLCGTVGSVRPLDPCGHIVCSACFDPTAYSACPICGRRLAAGDVYLPVVAPVRDESPATPALRLRRLTLTADLTAAAVRARDDLVAQPSALGQADVADLRTVVAATAPDRLDWLPEVVPARETLAVVVAWALHATALTEAYERGLADAAGRWSTVTDVARTLWAYSGGDPGLILPRPPRPSPRPTLPRPPDEPQVTVATPRVRALPRALRRAVLSFVDGLDPATAAEDVARHSVVWKRLAERLHPYEKAEAHPNAAVVFATLRGTRTKPSGALGRAMAAVAARRPDRLILTHHADGTVSVRVRTFAALVEEATAAGDTATATALLTDRPGDLWRRIDHLLRLAGEDPHAIRPVLDAAARTASRVSPTVLAGAAAALAGRDRTVAAAAEAVHEVQHQLAATSAGGFAALRRVFGRGSQASAPAGPPRPRSPRPGTPRRTFFPKGDVVRTWTAPEHRPPLPPTAISEIRTTVDTELANRAAQLDRFDIAVLDAALIRVPAPARQRAGSGQLAGWPRGSVRPLDHANVLRLFLHWVDGATFRVDLDLSCAFYDAQWNPLGHCDYTHLRFGQTAAIHSGDLTSAPPPLGATEFLDLDRAALAAAGVHWAVPVVFSYNDVPFDTLEAAFAGFSIPRKGGAQFDPARVLQRFDLRGNAESLAPLILNVPTGEVMWIDASLSTTGYAHSVEPHGARLGLLGADLWEHFTTGNRATLLDLAAWHAAARSHRIDVVHTDGTVTRVPVTDPAATVAAIRAAAHAATTGRPDPRPAQATVFAATVDPDRLATIAGNDVAAGSLALLVDGQAGPPWTPVTAADLAAGLIPIPPT